MSQKSSQVSPLPQCSIQTSAFTFPAVCLWSNVSLVFPIWKTCLLSFGPQCSCQCKSGRTLRPIDTDVRKDSLCTPRGLINDRSLLLQRVSRRVCVGGGSCYELQMWNYWIACYANSMMYYSTLGNMCLFHKARSYCTMSTRSLKMPIQ